MAAKSNGTPRLEAATFIGSKSLLAFVSNPVYPGRKAFRGWLVDGDARQRVNGSRVVFDARAGTDPVALLILTAAKNDQKLPSRGNLVVDGPEGDFALAPAIEDAEVPLEQFGADHLGKLDTGIRARLLEQIVDVAGPNGTGHAAEIAANLQVLRDAVRPSLPAAKIDPGADYGANVDGIWRVDDSTFYVKGWVFHGSRELGVLRLITPEGRRIDIRDGAFRYARRDVSEFFGISPRERLGFVAYVCTPERSVLPSGWILELGSEDGGCVEVSAPPVVSDPVDVRTMILHDLHAERLPEETLRANHMRPALARIEEQLSAAIEIDTVDQLGTPPVDPEVTIIVPLYRRMEFLEQQMAQFVHDPDIFAADLIYILDSPEEGDYVRSLAEQLFGLYEVPFRLVTLTANGGYSVVNNLGASLARGRKLLLLNSDVLPDKPGWLSSMVEFYDSNPAIGALAPKLLYEDDSIQHAGLYFDRGPSAHVWSNEHYFKGLHRDFAGANTARSVPAVTGACLLINAELYTRLGGLRGAYIRGDYEDSDLCLRLQEMNRESWYLPEVELYHLEGQSYPTAERSQTSDYNKWLHTHLWRERLSAMDDGR
jgi:GT2 family glycosyltransferase